LDESASNSAYPSQWQSTPEGECNIFFASFVLCTVRVFGEFFLQNGFKLHAQTTAARLIHLALSQN